MLKKTFLRAAIVSALFFSFSANATFFSFTNITNNSTTDLSDQLGVEVTQTESGLISFKFTNDTDGLGNFDSTVAQIYFDVGSTGFNTAGIAQQFGVAFISGANPPELPGGNTVSFESEFQFGAESPAPINGISDSSDYLTILGIGNLANIISAMNNDEFRIGLHVISIGNDSDGYVTSAVPSSVPLPAAAWLFASGLGFFGVARRRIQK